MLVIKSRHELGSGTSDDHVTVTRRCCDGGTIVLPIVVLVEGISVSASTASNSDPEI